METFTHKDHEFSLELRVDCDAGKPWEREDGHGVISEWTRRAKHPGELILCQDRDSYRYYDFAQTCKIARTVWGSKTRREAAEQARADYERMRSWCNDVWNYVGVCVHLLDNDGDSTGHSASLWGVESDCLDYINGQVAPDLADECLSYLLTVETLGEPFV